MRFLREIARAYPRRTLVTLVALLVAGVFEGISLSALFPILDLAANAESGGQSERGLGKFLHGLGIEPSLGPLLLIIVVGVSLKAAMVLLANRHVGYTVAQIGTDLRLRLLRALLRARWEFFLHQPVGSLANAMATETVRASNAYLSGARALAHAVETLVYTVAALFVSWQATLAAVLGGAAITLSLGRLVRKARRAGRRQTDVLVSLLRRMADTLQSVKALKTMGLAGGANVVLEAETRRLNKAMRKEVLSVEGLRAIHEPVAIAFVAGAAYLVVNVWGLPLASVVVLMLLLLRVLKLAGKLQHEYQKMSVNESAYWSLRGTIDRAEGSPEAEPHGCTPVFERELALEDVHFAFGDRPILRGLTLRLPASSFTTIVGPSGAGKTTILDLVTGLLEPTSGRLTLDGVALGECNLQAWRRMIGYVPQETLLLHESVLHNVILGDPDLTEGDAERALRAAGAWEFVSAMPEGMQTTVGERGSMLSGGQRQRISIARALVRRPKLLILDEATSALDPASEAALCETLARLRGEVTMLAVSHQTGLAEIADRVVRLEDRALVPMPVGQFAASGARPLA